MLKKLILVALLWPLLALAQNFPSPTFKNLTINSSVTANIPNLNAPQTPGVVGNVGGGPFYSNIVRTGGWGQYGNWLSLYTVTAATPAGQIDNGITSWATHENLTGGIIYGGWFGSNTPSKNLGETFTAGAAAGVEIDYGNRWGNLGYQSAIGATQWTVGLIVAPDVLPSIEGLDVANVTCTATSPGVCTWANHGMYNNMGVSFYGANPPGGTTSLSTLYVVNATTNTFEVASTMGGTPINFSSTGTAVQALPHWPGNFGIVVAHSIWGHQNWVADYIEQDAVVPGGVGHLDYGGSISSDAPLNWTQLGGYFGSGLNCTNATFTTTFCVQMGNLQAIEFGTGTSSMYGNSGVIQVAGPMQMVNSTFTPNSVQGIVGTTTNDSAQAGSVGQQITSDVPIGSAVSLTTSTAANITSVSLSAGDWMCQGSVQYNPAGTTVMTSLQAWMNTTSASRPATFETNGYVQLNAGSGSTVFTGTPESLQTGIWEFKSASTQTVYLSTTQAFTTSTLSGYGYLRCWRPR